jgi:hypothetical protein
LAVTQYKDVSWADGEPLDTNKLNTMVSNSRYLFERAAKVYYNAYGVHKDNGIKIACGTNTIPPVQAYSTSITVYFGSFFTPGCRPIVSTSITSSYNRRIIDTINGISGASALPDHRGFIAHLAAVELNDKANYLVRSMHLNWIAMGY